MKKELYFVIDVETDGPIPGPHSMLSLGCVVVDETGNELGNWYANFDLLEGATQDTDTMEFWSKNQKYYDLTRQWTQTPQEAMKHFCDWVNGFNCTPVAVAMPSGFDFTWVWWYCKRFVGYSPFSFSCLDMKTMAMCLLKSNYRESSKKYWPKHWFDRNLKHTHQAEDDAREQAASFIAMLKDLKQSCP